MAKLHQAVYNRGGGSPLIDPQFTVRRLGAMERFCDGEPIAKQNLRIVHEALRHSYWLQKVLTPRAEQDNYGYGVVAAEKVANRIANWHNSETVRTEADAVARFWRDDLLHITYGTSDHQELGGFAYAKRVKRAGAAAVADVELTVLNGPNSTFDRQRARTLALHGALTICCRPEDEPTLRVVPVNRPLVVELSKLGFHKTGENPRPDLFCRNDDNFEDIMTADSVGEVLGRLVTYNEWLADAQFS